MHARARRSLFSVSVVCAAAVARAQDAVEAPMQYGAHLVTTCELGGVAGTTTKALVIRLGDRGAVAFDTELLRMSAAWTDGWLRLRGTAYDGSHGPMPARRGRVVAETKPAPGWAHDGSFADPRPQPWGPLPRERARFEGFWLRGDDVVVGYRVGGMEVRETYSVEQHESVPVVVRSLELGASKIAQQMLVHDMPGKGRADCDLRSAQIVSSANDVVRTDVAIGAWSALRTGAPSSADWLDASSGSGASVRFVPGFARPHGRARPKQGEVDAPESLLLPRLHDGAAAENDDDTARSVWFDRHKVDGRDSDDGRFVVDLAKNVDVWRIATFSWHRAERAPQGYEVFGSAADNAPDAAAADVAAAGWTKIAAVDTGALGEGDKHGVCIEKSGGLGRFRHLLFVVSRGGTFFSEIDVFADRCKAPEGSLDDDTVAFALTGAESVRLAIDEQQRVVLQVPPHDAPIQVRLRMAVGTTSERLAARASKVAPIPTTPAKTRWGEPIVTKGTRGADDGPFAVDTITIPFDNRFHSRMRTGAFDFFADGRAAVSTWNGDVWVVSGIDESLERLEWRRFATGLFDPLGLRIVDDVVYVHGRDGITRLRDENGDGEADAYECFSNAEIATPAFHEFAFDLQTDRDGNFYFSKGAPVNPGGRGFMTIAPHHGTILKLSKDGATLAAIATGLRAPNGIGVSPTGIVTSGDNEGTFMPRCRLNWIEKPGYYAGVKDTAHRSPVPDAPDLPLCWFPMEVDNSSGGQVWVTGSGWSDLDGRLLHFSYGTCSAYLVLPDPVDGRMQGGVVRLPAEFSSSCMRGRFSAKDGQLYVIGLQGWQTSAARDGGFHRVRRTKQPLGLPTAVHTTTAGVHLTFAEALDPETAQDPTSYAIEVWNYLYSPNYGSPEVSLLQPERKVEQGKPNRDPLPITKATLSADGRSVFLAVTGMRPVHQIKLSWNVDAADRRPLKGEYHGSIHALAEGREER